MESPRIRAPIIEALRLAASAELQQSYALDAPIADVPAEVFCTWEDHYLPDSPWFASAFAPAERAALADYQVTCSEIARRVPDHVDLAAFQAMPEWAELAAAATRALEALRATSDDAV